MSKDYANYNRFQEACLETSFAIANIHDACKALLSSPTQESLDMIAEAAKKFQECSARMDASMIDFVKEFADVEEPEVTLVKTDVGYRV